MSEVLAERTEAYQGVAVPGFPNYFTVIGLNGVVSYVTFFLSAELNAAYITRLARRVLDDELRSIEAEPDATRSYNEAIQSELQTMSFSGACTSFWKLPSGKVVVHFPGSLGRRKRELRDIGEDGFRFESF